MKTILAADIGGTNCRLGLFKLQKNKLSMDKAAWIETGSIARADALMNAFERELETSPEKANAVSVAIAGPVEECVKGGLSNGNLELDFAPLNEKKKRYYLINDFMAQAYAVLSPEGERASWIAGPKKPAISGVRAVIGAGTGLGQAILAPLDGNKKVKTSHWLAVASENGHSAFPFVNGAENDFHTFLRTRLNIPYATGDETVTGRGLAALHEFLTGEKLTPAQVGGQVLSRDTPTLKWFSRFYARACRNWILSTMCEAGLWIAGGIAAQNPLVINSEYFHNELYNSPYRSKTWDDFLKSVPVFLMEDTNSGLWGAARFAQQELEADEPTVENVSNPEKEVPPAMEKMTITPESA
ncbi:MAG: glucokinase [Desulfovibrio sp.]|nr:glucokinase [Desulfovibrio sp.]